MPKTSALQFNDYTVDELMFKRMPVPETQNEFALYPQLNQNVIDHGDGHYDVCLSVKLEPTEAQPLPFQLHVSIAGHFSLCCGDEKLDKTTKADLLNKNAVSILFPFLRAIVATLTTSANVPTLVLPIMDFSGNT